MDIRPATPLDAPAMGRLIVESWLAAHKGQIPNHLWQARKSDWTPEISARNWARTLEAISSGNPDRQLALVACNENGIAGLTTGRWSEGEAPILTSLYVQTDCQGTGIGTSLLKTVADHYRDEGATALEIGVLEANAPARGFYEARGAKTLRLRCFNEEGTLLPECLLAIDLTRN